MVLIGKIITALAGRTVARTIGGVAAGPVGAAIGFILPTAIPFVARRLGPIGMVATAVGTTVFARWLERRALRHSGADAASPTDTSPRLAAGHASHQHTASAATVAAKPSVKPPARPHR